MIKLYSKINCGLGPDRQYFDFYRFGFSEYRDTTSVLIK